MLNKIKIKIKIKVLLSLMVLISLFTSSVAEAESIRSSIFGTPLTSNPNTTFNSIAPIQSILSPITNNSSVGISQSGTYTYDGNGRIVTFKSSDGSIILYQYDRNGNLLKKAPVQFLGYLDAPANTEISSLNLNIKGWYLDNSGVESIKVFIDNEYKGMATYGDSREDVYKQYPKFANHNSGFHFDTVLPNITHSFKIKIVIKDKVGIETNYEKTVNLKKTPSMGYLDSPAEGENFTYYGAGGMGHSNPENQLKISGWYLDLTPIKRIDVFVDGEPKYSGTVNRLSRIDVYNAYPQYGDKNSGFQVTIPKPPAMSSREIGKTINHKIKVIIVNNLNEQMVWERNIKVFYEDLTDPGTWT